MCGGGTNEWCLVSQQRYDADGVEPGTLNADPGSRHAGQALKEEARQDPAGRRGQASLSAGAGLWPWEFRADVLLPGLELPGALRAGSRPAPRLGGRA